MQRNDFKGLSLPRLGFGTMRLPQTPDGTIDEARTREMVRLAMESGVNYFDTAYPYHGGMSEIVIGRALSDYPRESFYLATKFPGHQISDHYDPAAVFEDQLRKCGVDYFDFYLLHNVCETSLHVYEDPRYNIIPYFLEQKKRGRIRHLGFSSHGAPENLRAFLDRHGDDMEFCQIQFNYLDDTLQMAREKYEMLTSRGIAVWVMEPVRGGRLVQLPEAAAARLREARPDESLAAWCFRWLQTFPNVKMILSGMSNEDQMRDNIRTFNTDRPLTRDEMELVKTIAGGLAGGVPCTACRYCCEGCPKGLDIPLLLAHYNDMQFQPSLTVGMRMENLPEDKRPNACISCGVCARICPQKIDIPGTMKKFAEALDAFPKWEDLSREREEAAKRLRDGRS